MDLDRRLTRTGTGVLLVGDVGVVDVVGDLELVGGPADVCVVADVGHGAAGLGLHQVCHSTVDTVVVDNLLAPET